MKIQCLIERDSVTTVMHNSVRFDFVPNDNGDYVCDIASPGSVNFFLNVFGGTKYKEYVEPEIAKEEIIKEESPKKKPYSKRL